MSEEMKKIQVLDHGYLAHVESWGSEERIVEAARVIRAFADGSGTLAHLPAFVGVAIFQGPMLVDEASAHVGSGSNIHAELRAILMALFMVRGRLVRRDEVFMLYSDSLWSIRAIERQYRVRSTHLPLVEEIRAQLERLPGHRLVHVRGHSGIPGNELADHLATDARRKFFSEASSTRPVMPDNEDHLAQPRYRPRAREAPPKLVCREPAKK